MMGVGKLILNTMLTGQAFSPCLPRIPIQLHMELITFKEYLKNVEIVQGLWLNVSGNLPFSSKMH